MSHAVHILQRDADAERGWAVFRHVVDCRLAPRAPFFTRMLQFCQRTLPSKAPDVMRAAFDQGVSVNETLFCLYLGACRQADPPLLRDALDLYRQVGPRTHNVICSLAGICRACQQPESALALVQDAIEHRLHMTEVLLSVFAACCAEAQSARAADTAKRLADLISSGQLPPYRNHPLYANLAKALLSQGRFDDAIAMIRLLDSIGMPPAQQLFGVIIGALAKAGRIEQAMAVFQTMVARGTSLVPQVFTSLVAACGSCSALQAVQTLYAYACNTEPALLQDAFVVNAFISGFARCCRLDLAQQLFRKCTSPHVSTYNTMIAAYSNNGDTFAAVNIFEEAKRTGSQELPIEMLCNMLCVFAKGDRVAEAMDMFDQIQQRNVRVDPAVLACLVAACGRDRQLDSLVRLHRFADSDLPLLHDAFVLGAFITSYGQCNRLDTAEDLFRSVQGRCSEPSSFIALIGAYATNGMVPQALDMWSELKRNSLHPTAAEYANLVASFSKSDAVVEALDVFEQLVKCVPDVDPRLLSVLIAACSRVQNVDAINRLHEYAVRKNLLETNNVLASAFTSAFGCCRPCGIAASANDATGPGRSALLQHVKLSRCSLATNVSSSDAQRVCHAEAVRALQ